VASGGARGKPPPPSPPRKKYFDTEIFFSKVLRRRPDICSNYLFRLRLPIACIYETGKKGASIFDYNSSFTLPVVTKTLQAKDCNLSEAYKDILKSKACVQDNRTDEF